VITHLAHDRALRLMSAVLDAGPDALDASDAAGPLDLTTAEAVAESELVTELGIGGASFKPGGAALELNELGVDNDQNAYLFAVSAVLVQAAREQAGENGSVDATLQELMNNMAAELANDGHLSASISSELKKAEQDLDVDLTMDLIARRLRSIGSNATAATLNRAIDTDGDGYRNSIDSCPLVANPDQAIVPNAVCKVLRHTTVLPGGSTDTRWSGSALVLGDFTHSGQLGLTGLPLNGSNPSALALLTGDGQGRFSAPVALQLDLDFLTTAFDIDKDGNLDVASQNGWSKGDGLGHFGSMVRFPDPVVGVDGGTVPDGGPYGLYPVYAGLAFGDFNGDQLVDVARLVSPGVSSETWVAVSIATSNGVFAPAELREEGLAATPSNGGWLGAADVNGDHRVDLIVVQSHWPSGTRLVALLGDGSGHFVPATPTLLSDGDWIYGFSGATVADFDNDGKLDVAIWEGGGQLAVAFGDGSGNFAPPFQTSFHPTNNFAPTFVAGDFNGDGRSDLVGTVGNIVDGFADLDVFVSQGRTFQATHLRTGVICGNPDGYTFNQPLLVTGDLNKDGIPDVVLVSADAKKNWTVQAILMNVQQ
jgi:hypothetical protein